jgi:hypothetical protein
MIMFECESGTVVETTELETPCWVGIPRAQVVYPAACGGSPEGGVVSSVS